MKICLICSAGGHLTQIRKLESLYKRYDYFFVTFFNEPAADLAQREPFYFVKDPGRNIINFIINIFHSIKIFAQEKPDIIISTGAGVTIPMCWIGRIFRKKLIFIESWSRVEKPSISGKLIYPIANLFIVQWEEMLKFYPKAVFKGALI